MSILRVARGEMMAKLIDLSEGVIAAARRRRVWHWPYAIERELAQIAVRHPYQPGGLPGREFAQGFF